MLQVSQKRKREREREGMEVRGEGLFPHLFNPWVAMNSRRQPQPHAIPGKVGSPRPSRTLLPPPPLSSPVTHPVVPLNSCYLLRTSTQFSPGAQGQAAVSRGPWALDSRPLASRNLGSSRPPWGGCDVSPLGSPGTATPLSFRLVTR